MKRDINKKEASVGTTSPKMKSGKFGQTQTEKAYLKKIGLIKKKLNIRHAGGKK